MSDGSNLACAAFGCPLPGAFRGFGLGDGWWCFLHSAGCDLQATTLRINAHAAAIKTVLRASNLGAHQWADASNQRYIADVMARHGLAELTPTMEEREHGAASWAYRARGKLRELCHVGYCDDLATQAEQPLAEAGESKPLRECFSGLHPADIA